MLLPLDTTLQAFPRVPVSPPLLLILIHAKKVEGVDGRALNDELFVVARGLEDVEWWSVYRLADGKPLFDTHVPVVIAGKYYAGVDVPADGALTAAPDADYRIPLL